MNSPAVTLPASRGGGSCAFAAPSRGQCSCESQPRQLGPGGPPGRRTMPAGVRTVVGGRAPTCTPSGPDGRFRRSAVRPILRTRPSPVQQGKARPLGHRPAPGVPRPARRRLLAPVQHRVPGGVPGRDELPRLPQPRRRGPVRGGLHPVARPESGRRDVLVRLLGAVRARLPPRRHRPAARDPGHEAVPRRVARGVRASPTSCRRSRRARSASRSSGPGRPGSPSRASWRPRATRSRSSTACRTAAARCSSACPPSACRARRSRWTSGSSSDSASRFVYDTTIGVDITFEELQRDFDGIAITAGAMDAVALDIPGRRPRGRPVRRRLHEEGEPRPAARGRDRRRRHRRRLHRDGLLADEPAARRRARLDRLPAHPLRARRRRGGAGRDRARRRPDGVPRQPDRGPRRGRQGHRRQVHPQPARRARRVRPPLPGPDRGLRVRHPGPDRHPGRVAGRRPDLPAGRGEVRDQPRPGQGRSGDLRHERPRRVRLRRLRDRPDDAHRGGRPRQEVRLRDRPLPVRADRRDRRGERQDHELVAPRHARVLRRPAAPAHPDGPAHGADAVDRAGGQLQHPGRARLRRQRRRSPSRRAA